MPPVIFWEMVFGTRCACLCGSMDRQRVEAVRMPIAVPVVRVEAMDFDRMAEERASNEGMAERDRVMAAIRAKIMDNAAAMMAEEDRAEERANGDGMPDRERWIYGWSDVRKPVPSRKYRQLLEATGEAAVRKVVHNTVDERFGTWLITQSDMEQPGEQAEAHDKDDVVLRDAFHSPAERLKVAAGS